MALDHRTLLVSGGQYEALRCLVQGGWLFMSELVEWMSLVAATRPPLLVFWGIHDLVWLSREESFKILIIITKTLRWTEGSWWLWSRVENSSFLPTLAAVSTLYIMLEIDFQWSTCSCLAIVCKKICSAPLDSLFARYQTATFLHSLSRHHHFLLWHFTVWKRSTVWWNIGNSWLELVSPYSHAEILTNYSLQALFLITSRYSAKVMDR